MPPDPGVTVVFDRNDDPTLVDQLARRCGRTTGKVLVRPVPRLRKEVDLAADILISLGKRFDALTREKQIHRAWLLVQLWLRAESIRQLVIMDADRLPASLWLSISELAEAARVRVWLVASSGPPTSQQKDAAGEPEPAAVTDLLSQLPESSPGAPPAHDAVEGPLPRADFLTFRARCRQSLTPERFAAVDEVYRRAFDATVSTAEWLGAAGRVPTEAAVVEHVRRLTVACSGPAEAQICLRAAQAAFFTDGVLVLAGLVAGRWANIPAVGLTPEVATRLRRLVSPELAAAFALVAAHRDRDPAKLNMSAVNRGGGTIVLPDMALTIPEHGRALVEAHRLQRLQGGAEPDDPFFVSDRGRRVNGAAVRRLVAKAGELAAVGLPEDRLERLWNDPAPQGFRVEVGGVHPAQAGDRFRWVPSADEEDDRSVPPRAARLGR